LATPLRISAGKLKAFDREERKGFAKSAKKSGRRAIKLPIIQRNWVVMSA
jgi:hypothetical protein